MANEWGCALAPGWRCSVQGNEHGMRVKINVVVEYANDGEADQVACGGQGDTLYQDVGKDTVYSC
jgi:hypothetical protein